LRWSKKRGDLLQRRIKIKGQGMEEYEQKGDNKRKKNGMMKRMMKRKKEKGEKE